MDSGIKFNRPVIKPGSESDTVNFSELSVSGSILNAYNAFKRMLEINPADMRARQFLNYISGKGRKH